MSKISNCLTMLRLLNNGTKINIKTLAETLEVSERMVRTYKQDLELAGFYIETISGRYGGYIIDDKQIENIKKFISLSDLQFLESIYLKYFENNSNIDSVNFRLLLEKLRINLLYNNNEYSNTTENSSEIDINKFEYAIKNKRKMQITYIRNEKRVVKVFEPITIIIYNDKYFITGLTHKGIRTFCLNELIEYKILN